jgi:hypothetical protein
VSVVSATQLDVKLCECGCGTPAPIAKMTDSARGVVRGQPQRFVKGHSCRLQEQAVRIATQARLRAERAALAAELAGEVAATPRPRARRAEGRCANGHQLGAGVAGNARRCSTCAAVAAARWKALERLAASPVPAGPVGRAPCARCGAEVVLAGGGAVALEPAELLAPMRCRDCRGTGRWDDRYESKTIFARGAGRGLGGPGRGPAPLERVEPGPCTRCAGAGTVGERLPARAAQLTEAGAVRIWRPERGRAEGAALHALHVC